MKEESLLLLSDLQKLINQVVLIDYTIIILGGILMDITALSSSMSLADVSSQVGIAVLAKNLDTIETLGDGMKKMMEMSVNPNLGASIDVQV